MATHTVTNVAPDGFVHTIGCGFRLSSGQAISVESWQLTKQDLDDVSAGRITIVPALDEAQAGLCLQGISSADKKELSQKLSEHGDRIIAGGGQVNSVVAGTANTVDVTDPVNPIVNVTLGTGAGEAAEGNDARFPTSDEKDAMTNAATAPTAANPFLTAADAGGGGGAAYGGPYFGRLYIFTAGGTNIMEVHGFAMDNTNTKLLTVDPDVLDATNGDNDFSDTPPNNSWIYVHLIGDSTKTNPDKAFLSTSRTAPTLPGGYDLFTRIGTVRYGTAGFHHLVQRDNFVRDYGPDTAGAAAEKTVGSFASYPGGFLDFSTACPPTAVRAYAHVYASLEDGTGFAGPGALHSASFWFESTTSGSDVGYNSTVGGPYSATPGDEHVTSEFALVDLSPTYTAYFSLEANFGSSALMTPFALISSAGWVEDLTT